MAKDKGISLQVLEVIIYVGIVLAFILPVFKPAESEGSNSNSQLPLTERRSNFR